MLFDYTQYDYKQKGRLKQVLNPISDGLSPGVLVSYLQKVVSFVMHHADAPILPKFDTLFSYFPL